MRSKRRKNLIILLLILISFILLNFSVSKYKLQITEYGSAKVAEPIIVFEKDKVISKEYNKKSEALEYIFKIKNYENDKVNEVEFLYNIEILENNNMFPVEYKLINLSNNKEVELIQNKSENFKIGVLNKQEDIYKLEVFWKDKNIDNYSDSIQIDLKANIVQLYN